MAQESGMFTVHQTVGSVLCCLCGTPMPPNATNMCVACVRTEYNITEDLTRQAHVTHCPECDTWLQPPKTWIKAPLESKELLVFCLNKLGLKNKGVRLVQADFIWTEPHSKRLKVKVKVQKEVQNGAILEQAYVVEYVVLEQMCDLCSRAQANPDQWGAVVQLRQHVSHRRTFFFLEQLILKHDAAAKAVRIKQMDRGIDFFFANWSHGRRFVDFIGKFAPIRSHESKRLISQDLKSNKANHKFTFSVEICPICREDLILLPQKVAHNHGNIGPLVICTKVSNSIFLLDPFTLRQCILDENQFWRVPFKSLLSSRQLVEYIVLDVETVSLEINVGGSKYMLADAQVARVSDFGKNDQIFSIRTHLGQILKPGDYALGYDLYAANCNDDELENYRGFVLPDALLIKKSYEQKRQGKAGKARPWKLKSLNMEVDISAKDSEDKRNSEYEQFIRDLEENPEMRFNISLYHNKGYQPSEMASVTDGEDVPSVPLEELLAELDLSDEEMEDAARG